MGETTCACVVGRKVHIAKVYTKHTKCTNETQEEINKMSYPSSGLLALKAHHDHISSQLFIGLMFQISELWLILVLHMNSLCTPL